jgi:CheY-like chemotaxis protein
VKPRVLVVEDDEDVRETTRMMLELDGHRVLTAKDGREALAILAARHQEIGLVLLDGIMPVMNGWEFLEARRHSPELTQVPTFVVSAAQPAPSAAALANGFLSKPVETDELLRLARRYCEER